MADPQTPDQADVRESLAALIDGTKQLSEIQESLHPKMLILLQVAKKESLLARNFDRARSCNELIKRLHISDVGPVQVTEEVRMRSRSMLSQTRPLERLPPISAFRNRSDDSDPAKATRVQTELEACERFWDSEFRRFGEMKESARKEFLKKQSETVRKMEKGELHVRNEEAHAARILRERGAAHEDQRNVLNQRADMIDQMENDYRRGRARQVLRKRVQNLRDKQVEERAEFERSWDARLVAMRRVANGEVGDRKACARKLPSMTRPWSCAQGEREMLRKSCPVSILQELFSKQE